MSSSSRSRLRREALCQKRRLRPRPELIASGRLPHHLEALLGAVGRGSRNSSRRDTRICLGTDRSVAKIRGMGFRSNLGPIYWKVREVAVVGAAARCAYKVYTSSHVAAYRRTAGLVGGRSGKAPVLLLSTKGRRSGQWRTTPLMYLATDTALVVVASAGGSSRHPNWFLNLKADPRCVVEADRSRRDVMAREAPADERSRLWPRLVQIYAGWDEYQRRTDRRIPVVLLEPVPVIVGERAGFSAVRGA